MNARDLCVRGFLGFFLFFAIVLLISCADEQKGYRQYSSNTTATPLDGEDLISGVSTERAFLTSPVSYSGEVALDVLVAQSEIAPRQGVVFFVDVRDERGKVIRGLTDNDITVSILSGSGKVLPPPSSSSGSLISENSLPLLQESGRYHYVGYFEAGEEEGDVTLQVFLKQYPEKKATTHFKVSREMQGKIDLFITQQP